MIEAIQKSIMFKFQLTIAASNLNSLFEIVSTFNPSRNQIHKDNIFLIVNNQPEFDTGKE